MNRYGWLNLIKQPSTWAGFSVLLAMFGVHVAPDYVVQVGTAVAATAAIFIPEGN